MKCAGLVPQLPGTASAVSGAGLFFLLPPSWKAILENKSDICRRGLYLIAEALVSMQRILAVMYIQKKDGTAHFGFRLVFPTSTKTKNFGI